MMIIKKTFLILICVSLAQPVVTAVRGFEIPAHRDLSRRATEVSNLDGFLKDYLSSTQNGSLLALFPNGINEFIFNGKTVIQLMQDGAENEDKPDVRVRHHFHNPRLAWDQAGLRPPLFPQLGQSSVLWSQNPNQIVGGKHSWQDARNSYFQALTATTDSERRRLFAETFRSLGHQMHLIQDAAAPSHTRNDTHLSYFGIGDVDGFHVWAESQDARVMIAGIGSASLPLPPFDRSLFEQQSANPLAPIPIARVIDATDGDRTTLETGVNIGIAEYSSANFFSDDTVYSQDFPFPGLSNLQVGPLESGPVTQMRRYLYFQPGFGETDYALATASALFNLVDESVAPTDRLLDNKVLEDYGRKLFPRAVSYSKGLIDYFFRGTHSVSPHASPFCFAFPYGDTPNQLEIEFANCCVAGEPREPEEIGGNYEVLINLVYIPIDDPWNFQKYKFFSSDPKVVNLPPGFPGFFNVTETFFFPTAPVAGVNESVLLFGVFKGKLGKEEQAVFFGDGVITPEC